MSSYAKCCRAEKRGGTPGPEGAIGIAVEIYDDVVGRQAARTETGREKVVSSLKTLENYTGRVSKDDRMATYDFSWMWTELGAELQRKQQLFPSEIKSEHTGGVVRRELASTEYVHQPEQSAVSAHPGSEIIVCERHCNIACRIPERGAGVARRIRRYSRHRLKKLVVLALEIVLKGASYFIAAR
jgi:hypothetical protein